jgi:hypothetical protein
MLVTTITLNRVLSRRPPVPRPRLCRGLCTSRRCRHRHCLRRWCTTQDTRAHWLRPRPRIISARIRTRTHTPCPSHLNLSRSIRARLLFTSLVLSTLTRHRSPSPSSTALGLPPLFSSTPRTHLFLLYTTPSNLLHFSAGPLSPFHPPHLAHKTQPVCRARMDPASRPSSTIFTPNSCIAPTSV